MYTFNLKQQSIGQVIGVHVHMQSVCTDTRRISKRVHGKYIPFNFFAEGIEYDNTLESLYTPKVCPFHLALLFVFKLLINLGRDYFLFAQVLKLSVQLHCKMSVFVCSSRL